MKSSRENSTVSCNFEEPDFEYKFRERLIDKFPNFEPDEFEGGEEQ